MVLLPSNTQAWFNLAMNHLEQSRVTAEVETSYQRVITLDPGGHLSPVSGAIIQEINDILAVLNALRTAFPSQADS